MSRSNDGLFTLAAASGLLLLGRELMRRSRRYELRGKNVLITGASRGLGLVLARECVRQGARVAICARYRAELESACEDLCQRDARAIAVTCDVTDRRQVAEMLRIVESRLGPVDVLINNAGVIQTGPMEEMTLEDYEEAMRTHFWAPLYTTLAVLPGMRERGHGRIVNISSIGGKLAPPHLLPYSASKFALTGFSEGLRAEVVKDGVYVTTVCPGLMRTGSPINATFKGQHRKEYAWFSISDAMPGLAMAAERAAHKILEATKNGESEVILTVPAKLGALFHGLFPGLTADLMGLANRFLPGPGGIGTDRAFGGESTSSASPSWATTLGDRAAERNNELVGWER